MTEKDKDKKQTQQQEPAEESAASVRQRIAEIEVAKKKGLVQG